MAGCCMISVKMTITKQPYSVCNPTLSINRMNLPISLIYPVSFPVCRLHDFQPSKLLPINKKIFTCRCTKEEKPSKTKTGSDDEWTHFVSKLHTVWVNWVYILRSKENPLIELCKLPFWLCLLLILGIVVTFRIGSKTKEPRNDVPFDELLGIEYIRPILENYVSILKKKTARKFGPDHLLLYGPPGAGKATVVHALARKAGVAFFPLSAIDIVKTGPTLLETIFSEAIIRSPSIVFIEDVDLIAQHESDPNLIKLISEMEDCNMSELLVLVIVATSIPDPLYVHAFTFHHFILLYVGKPHEDCRRKTVGLHLKGALREEDKEAICNLVASQTSGLGWRDLIYVARESIRQAFNRGDDHVSVDDAVKVLGELKLNINDDKDEPMAQENTQLGAESMTFGTHN